MMSSTLYTIGTALTRANDSGVPVDVLVAGQWLHGDVSAVDGHGVVLQSEDGSLAMIRVESIMAVLVRHVEAFEGGDAADAHDAHPMPRATDRYAGEPHAVRPRASIEGHWSQQDSIVR